MEDHAAALPVGPVVRVLETETALEAQPTVVAAAQSQAGRMDGLIQKLHAGTAAGLVADPDRVLGGRARSIPPAIGKCADYHHEDQAGHGDAIWGQPELCASLCISF